MGEWKEFILGDIAEVQTGPFGSQLHMSDYKLTGTPIITVEHLGDNKIIHSNLPLVGDDDKNRLIKYTLKEGDIVFSRVGSVDRRAYVRKSEDGWMFSGRCLRVRANDNLVNSRFLSFYFGQESFKETIRMVAVGATMPSINTTILSEIEVILPPLPQQTAIAEVLSSLDDKIDLLHRQNKTLEQLAETLFRQWFLPASAGQAGVEEAEESWDARTLGDVISIYDSKRIPVSSGEREKMKVGQLYPYYGAVTIMDYVNNYIFDGEYILMGEDGTVQTPDGYPVLQLPTGKFWVNNHAHIFQAKKPFTNFFIYIFLKQTNISGIVTGAVQPKINQEALKGIDFPFPPEKLRDDFVRVTDEMWEKIKSNTQQIRTLTQLRDTLLPKLMSGEVRLNLDLQDEQMNGIQRKENNKDINFVNPQKSNPANP
ncbi:MAG: restriction endonuclease subunit S [Chitinophagaceae bacterium]|nr:restriction endonuclease subunit S [Chitinophagaceae bacterium]